MNIREFNHGNPFFIHGKSIFIESSTNTPVNNQLKERCTHTQFKERPPNDRK
jgi:hypothetical protein